jgi:SWIM zinc finger
MVKQLEVNGDQVIIGGNGALVASQSEPGNWHIVRNSACDCKGYQYRGYCRHIAAVKAANGLTADECDCAEYSYSSRATCRHLEAAREADAGHAAYVAEWNREEAANVEYALRYAS